MRCLTYAAARVFCTTALSVRSSLQFPRWQPGSRWLRPEASGALLALLAIGLIGSATTFAADTAEPLRFNRDIRPILSDNCFFCHGPDKNKRQADLRLDTQVGLHGDGTHPGVVVAGQPDQSELVHRILSRDPEKQMPPPDSGKALTAAEIALIQQWIREGGQFEGHWAFRPRPEDRSTVTDSDTQASAHIDQFVRERLATRKLSPAPEADRITLLRRLQFDLLGLPPTEAEVADFLRDQAPGAYERQVDRLLASPHFGERLAVWWLDLVRYADTVGYHGDQNMSVSPYRDYVIASFNANKRFDQFTIEQLGGDLLTNPTPEQRIASGYNRLGMMSAEGGVQDREYLAKYMAERVRNVSGVWLGITLGCCECHDHKFDPFATRDFYSMGAFFADIKEQGLYGGSDQTGIWGPSMKVPNPEQSQQLAQLNEQLAATKRTLETATPELSAAQADWERQQVAWTVITPTTMAAQSGSPLTQLDDRSIRADGSIPATDIYTLQFRQLPAGITGIRLEVLPDDSLPQRGPGRASNGNFVLTEFVAQMERPGSPAEPVPFQTAVATHEQTSFAEGHPDKRWSIASAIDGDTRGNQWGWAILDQAGRPQSAVFETKADLHVPADGNLNIILRQEHPNPGHTLGRFRLSVTTAPRPLRPAELAPPAIREVLQIAADARTAAQREQLAAYYRTIAPALAPQREQLAALEARRAAVDAQVTVTLVTETVAPRMVRILSRGNWMDETGPVVTPALPGLFATAPPGEQRLTRLDLARWIVSKENPLTARTLVNRLWKIYFGAGLSRKLDDLGAQGEWPSHPELLDYLASRTIETGWDLKRLVKTIVMSETYRQSSISSPQLREIDPDNRLLARQGRFRLDAELVRDNALSVSGLLVTRLGGKSVRPYQPPGYWAYLNFPQREWQNGTGDELYRRGLYTHWQRQYLHPSLLAFDAPCREECTADRPRSNTPLQSLVLLNDPTYVEAARAFAELILHHGGNDQEKLSYAFQRALSRPSTAAENAVLLRLLNEHRTQYQAEPSAAQALISVGARPASNEFPLETLAAWTDVARTILNLHEVITRN